MEDIRSSTPIPVPVNRNVSRLAFRESDLSPVAKENSAGPSEESLEIIRNDCGPRDEEQPDESSFEYFYRSVDHGSIANTSMNLLTSSTETGLTAVFMEPPAGLQQVLVKNKKQESVKSEYIIRIPEASGSAKRNVSMEDNLLRNDEAFVYYRRVRNPNPTDELGNSSMMYGELPQDAFVSGVVTATNSPRKESDDDATTTTSTTRSTTFIDADQYSGLCEYSDEFLAKINDLQMAFEANILGCEAKWLLFVSAALSYRYSIKMSPYPRRYAWELSAVNIEDISGIIYNTPNFNTILKCFQKSEFKEINYEVVDLVYWLLVQESPPDLIPITSDDRYDWTLVSELTRGDDPKQIFAVANSPVRGPAVDMMVPRKLGFYAAKVDCLHTVLHRGFPPGEPVMLHKSLRAVVERANMYSAWGPNGFGNQLCCIAICEYINDSEFVGKGRVALPNCSGSYRAILVTRPESLKLRYLLFYDNFGNTGVNYYNLFSEWILNNKKTVYMGGYILAAIAFGFLNTRRGCCRRLLTTIMHSLYNFSRPGLV